MREQQIAEMVEKSEVKNFKNADEVREFPHGRLELVKIGGVIVGRAKLEPGWKWSESVQPIVKTDSCEAAHFQYFLSGTLRVRMDDGTEFECHAGDVCLIPPGHEAWVVGDEPVEVVDFQGMSTYAESE
jgi:mannose-6-phosphate isomerase-like protein (cupin superfamily)